MASNLSSQPLRGQTVVLGVCGGVAAYKSAELVRLLKQNGAEVQVVMTEAATRFVTPLTFQALSGQPVLTSMWPQDVPGDAGNPSWSGSDLNQDGMMHIHATRGARLLVVAPASANLLAKLAGGLCDDLLSTLIAARPRQQTVFLLAPAMNHEMWHNPATQRAVAQLRADGAVLVGPAPGDLACGEVGDGRMSAPADIVQAIIDQLAAQATLAPAADAATKRLAGRRVLITAGPTFEAIDPVRGLTNRSSGKMGFALARAAQEAGAEVTLVYGPVNLTVPIGVRGVSVESAEQMWQAVQTACNDASKGAPGQHVFIAAAAVADWRPALKAQHKLKKQFGQQGQLVSTPTLELVPNPDILAWVAQHCPDTLCLGFAAETDALLEHAREKRQRKGVALLAVNHGPSTFGRDDNEMWLLHERGEEHLPRADKLTQAQRLIAAIAARLPKQSP